MIKTPVNAWVVGPDTGNRRPDGLPDRIQGDTVKIPIRTRRSLSVWALVLANLIPVAGVLFLGWSAANVVLLYWAENLIVGFYGLLRIAAMPVESPVEHLGKVFMIPFFTLHFGGFCAVHGLFLMILLGAGGEAEPIFPNTSWPGPLVFMQLLVSVVVHLWKTRPPEMTIPLIALFASHGISFFENYVFGDERRSAGGKDQMARPYRRIVITHITILAGAVPVMAFGAPVALLAVLVAMKLAFDLYHHIKSHRRNSAGTDAGGERDGARRGPGRPMIRDLIRILNSRSAERREPDAPEAGRQKVKQD
jgi:hypothetical protein